MSSVPDFLRLWGLQELTAKFEDEGIDVEALFALTPDLINLLVPQIGQRAKLIKHLSQHKEQADILTRETPEATESSIDGTDIVSSPPSTSTTEGFQSETSDGVALKRQQAAEDAIALGLAAVATGTPLGFLPPGPIFGMAVSEPDHRNENLGEQRDSKDNHKENTDKGDTNAKDSNERTPSKSHPCQETTELSSPSPPPSAPPSPAPSPTPVSTPSIELLSRLFPGKKRSVLELVLRRCQDDLRQAIDHFVPLAAGSHPERQDSINSLPTYQQSTISPGEKLDTGLPKHPYSSGYRRPPVLSAPSTPLARPLPTQPHRSSAFRPVTSPVSSPTPAVPLSPPAAHQPMPSPSPIFSLHQTLRPQHFRQCGSEQRLWLHVQDGNTLAQVSAHTSVPPPTQALPSRLLPPMWYPSAADLLLPKPLLSFPSLPTSWLYPHSHPHPPPTMSPSCPDCAVSPAGQPSRSEDSVQQETKLE